MAVSPPIQLRQIRSFFVGGTTRVLEGLPVTYKSMVLNGAPREVNPNGSHTFGQMYVQEYRLAKPVHPHPILMWHGGGMTGCTWETTPDGRPGWLWRFLEAGYDVLICDAVERGRSSWAMYPQIYETEPVFRTKQEGWTTFRIGLSFSDLPDERHIFPGQKFPIGHFDEFAKQWVPRWPNHEPLILSAYEALVERAGPCILVGHSQGAGFAAEIARRKPSLVRKVVAVEPGGVPSGSATTALPPHLVVWGDHIVASGKHWTGYRKQATAYFAEIADKTSITTLDLPEAGIQGNSHFPMMDVNSDEIFSLVDSWLNKSTH